VIFPEEMVRIRISGPKSSLRETINCLHELKLVHLINHEDRKTFDIGQPFEEAELFSEKLLKLRSIISFFKLKGEPAKIKNLKKAIEKFDLINEKFDSLTSQISVLKQKIKELQEEKRLVLLFESLKINKDLLQGFKKLVVFTGTIKSSVKEKLEEKIKDFELIESTFNEEKVIALFVPVEKKELTQSILSEAGFSEISFNLNKTSKEVLKELSELTASLENKSLELEKLKNNNLVFLISLEKALSIEIEKAEAPLRIAVSLNAFIIEGWIPKKEAKKINKKIETNLKKRVFVECWSQTEGAPIKLENPKPIEPFQFFMNLYSLPKYYEIDPSFLMFFTFPLFFGFMLGDIGYGIVTLVLFYVLSRKLKGEAKALTQVMVLASIATIFFGFIFGEFFGAEISEHPLLNRAHDISTMLLVSVVVGLIHINLGFLIGFINALRHHGLMHAILGKISWFVLELGIILIAAEFLGLMSNTLIAGLIVVLIAVGMLFKGEGINGVIEIPTLASNALSYARLFAVGLASVQLAIIINEFAGNLIQAGGIFIIGAILLLLSGHGVNIALGIIGPFLQSLRLHYVEFFTKFFEGGGKPFSPFGQEK
jgi:V/A-type H+-transporting ATPase subunit I